MATAAGRPLSVKLIDLGMATRYNPDKPIRGAAAADTACAT